MWIVQRLETVQLPLVNKFYKANRARGKAKGNESVWVVKDKDEIVGAARVADISGHDFLTGVQVAGAYQRQGIAAALVSQIVKTQQKPCFTFPYGHLVGLYQYLGFVEIEADDLPKPLLMRFGRYQGQGREIVVMRALFAARVLLPTA
ncbi:MAG: GNAT family N-acetyltransferase [Algicola sp.]|nr:GNAT family N-acetyltransferase [Algicola sp.]